MNDTIKMLWHSNSPWSPTGYGSQTALFAPHLKAHYDLAISSFYGLEGARLIWSGIPVLPGMGQDFGNVFLHEHAKAHFDGDPKGGLVVTLHDVWVLDPQRVRQMQVACWTPVDHEPPIPSVIRFFKESGAVPIAMSRFGEEQLRNAGLDPLYCPHGVDTKVYQPHDKKKVREEAGVPNDVFLVGMVAANKGAPSRKGFQQALEAFSHFHRKHEDSLLYLHTVPDPKFAAGEDIVSLTQALGIADSVVTAPQYRMLFDPMPPATMAQLYSSFDCLLNCSMGEGFGIPILEAAACFPAETPVRVKDPLAMQSKPYTGRLVKIETARGSFEATADHPVWTSKGWQSAGSIRPGDQLLYSHARKGVQEIHAGTAEEVARGIRDDALAGSGSPRWDGLRQGVLADLEQRVGAQAAIGVDSDEARGYDRTGVALLRRPDRRRGYGDDSEATQGSESTAGLEAVGLRQQYGQTHDGLDLGAGSWSRRASRFASSWRRGISPRRYSGAWSSAVLSPSSTIAGYQRRLDGGGYRVVRDSAVSVQAGTLDAGAARHRVADSGTEYESVEAVSSRDVRDLPVYNFTTGSGLYEVGPGYLVHNCGVPSIVTNFSSMPEVAGPAGWPVGCRPYWTPGKSWQAIADVPEIVEALEQCYSQSNAERNARSEAARNHALQYDVEHVMEEYMLPALASAWDRFEERKPLEAVAA